MGERPLVSILIPTFNRSGMLTQGIESASRQTYVDIEIIVADNCSTDDTPTVVAGLAARDTRIRYVRHDENLGYLGNMRSLLDEAKGEFLKFCMDDDVLMDDCVDTLIRPCLADRRIGLATSKRTLVDEHLEPLPDIAATQAITATGHISGHQLGDLVLRTNLNLIGEASTVLFRRDLLDERAPFAFGAQDFEAILDVSLWLHLLAKSDAYYCPTPKSLFRHHGGQGGADYIAPFLGVIEWGRLIAAGREVGFLADRGDEFEAWSNFLKAAAWIQHKVTDPDHDRMLAEAVARAGDRLQALAVGRGGAEERTADGRATRALREVDRAAALRGIRPVATDADDGYDAVLLVPDGAEPRPDWSIPLLSVLDAFPGVGAVIGVREHPDGRRSPGLGGVALRPQVAALLTDGLDLDVITNAGWQVSYAPNSVVRETLDTYRDSAYDVSVVLAVHNPGDALLRCLTAVSDHTAEGTYEVVIVDNRSTDGTAMLLDCLEGDVQVIRNEGDCGYSKAVTQGVWQSRGRDIVLMSAAAEVRAGWLDEAINALAGDPFVGAVRIPSCDAILIRRTAYADGAGLDDRTAPGAPLDRLLARMARRGWRTSEL